MLCEFYKLQGRVAIGLCFWSASVRLIGLIGGLSWDVPVWQQCIIGAVIITAVEFMAGCIGADI